MYADKGHATFYINFIQIHCGHKKRQIESVICPKFWKQTHVTVWAKIGRQKATAKVSKYIFYMQDGLWRKLERK